MVLRCSITDAKPTVQASVIKWKKGGQYIAGKTGATLNIGTVQKSDAGNYVCEAKNDAGTGTSPSVMVDVRCKYIICANRWYTHFRGPPTSKAHNLWDIPCLYNVILEIDAYKINVICLVVVFRKYRVF